MQRGSTSSSSQFPISSIEFLTIKSVVPSVILLPFLAEWLRCYDPFDSCEVSPSVSIVVLITLSFVLISAICVSNGQFSHVGAKRDFIEVIF